MVLASSLWLIWLGHAILSNVIVASLLAIFAMIVGWRLRRPAMAHGLWVLVLIKLVTPPLVHMQVPVPGWMDFSQVAVVSLQSNAGSQESGFAKDANLEVLAASAIPLVHGRDLEANARFGADSRSIRHGLANSIGQFLLIVWLSIALFLMMRSLARSIRFARVLEAEGKEQADALKLGLQMAEALGIRKCPRIRLISASLSPMLFGFSNWATIVIPSGLWSELNNAQRRAMLAHELSHYMRRDHWVRGIELIVGSLFFWLPLVRFARAQIERMEETCCDLNAVNAIEKNRRLYAESLLQVVDYISQRGGRMPGLASGMRPTITLEERLRCIMNDNATGRMTQRHQSLLGIVGLFVVLTHPLASSLSNSVITLDANSNVEPVRPNTLSSNEKQPWPDGGFLGKLPEVPRGWWNEMQHVNAVRTLPIASGQKTRLKFNPGVFIDVIFADETSHRLAESEPTAMVTLPHTSRLIVGNSKGDIRLWDVEWQQSVSWIGHHEGPITTLCYHPKFGLLSGDANGLVLQWEIQSGAIQNSWSSHRGPIQSIRCDRDGDQVAMVFGEWKNHVEYSSLAFMNPLRWTVTSTIDVPVSMATIFDRAGMWHAIDWNGYVYPIPFQQKMRLIPKADVSAIAFSQDAEIPVLQSISVNTLSDPFILDAPEL